MNVVSAEDRPTSRLARWGATDLDFRAMDHVRRRMSYRARAEAVRFAVRQQELRDDYFRHLSAGRAKAAGLVKGHLIHSVPAKAEYDRIVRAVIARTARTPGPMPDGSYRAPAKTVTQWSMHTYPDIDKALAAVQRAWEITDQAATYRVAVQVEAILAGFDPDTKARKV